MPAIPTDWPALRKAAASHIDEDVRDLEREASLATRVLEREVPTLTRAFNGSPDPLARVLAIEGAERARELCFLADKALPRLLAYGNEPPERAPASAVSVLSYVAILRCLDVALPEEAEPVQPEWLRIIAERPDLLDDDSLRTAGLAAVAVGKPDLVPSFDGGGPLEPRREEQGVAGMNVRGFTRHLAEAQQGEGGMDAVDTSWRNFVQSFPMSLAAEGASWADLVWASMAVMVHFEHRPASAVGTWLPKFISQLD